MTARPLRMEPEAAAVIGEVLGDPDVTVQPLWDST
jgi:hypothetical protein